LFKLWLACGFLHDMGCHCHYCSFAWFQCLPSYLGGMLISCTIFVWLLHCYVAGYEGASLAPIGTVLCCWFLLGCLCCCLCLLLCWSGSMSTILKLTAEIPLLNWIAGVCHACIGHCCRASVWWPYPLWYGVGRLILFS
jgi:hypothetical protein